MHSAGSRLFAVAKGLADTATRWFSAASALFATVSKLLDTVSTHLASEWALPSSESTLRLSV
jgi:hypothetical protein